MDWVAATRSKVPFQAFFGFQSMRIWSQLAVVLCSALLLLRSDRVAGQALLGWTATSSMLKPKHHMLLRCSLALPEVCQPHVAKGTQAELNSDWSRCCMYMMMVSTLCTCLCGCASFGNATDCSRSPLIVAELFADTGLCLQAYLHEQARLRMQVSFPIKRHPTNACPMIFVSCLGLPQENDISFIRSAGCFVLLMHGQSWQ